MCKLFCSAGKQDTTGQVFIATRSMKVNRKHKQRHSLAFGAILNPTKVKYIIMYTNRQHRLVYYNYLHALYVHVHVTRNNARNKIK